MSAPFTPSGALGMEETPCDLRVVKATKHYGDFTLGPIDMDVPRGTIVGLIGQNGAGKTTLMKGIMGVTHLDGGHVELFGRDVTGLADAELAKVKERIGFVSAVCAYPQGMTVREVARMHSLAYPQFDQARFDELATQMGLLPTSAAKKIKDLSRGMGMKLQLCCALAVGVSLLVMDEPTAGLDPIVREEVLDIMRTWMEDEGRSALISSHITSDLDRLADYLVLIDNGRVLMTCERDAVAEMGVARLRSAELERVVADGFVEEPHYLRHDLNIDLLVPDRLAFMRRYPDFVCDPASIDDVMVLLVKGEVR